MYERIGRGAPKRCSTAFDLPRGAKGGQSRSACLTVSSFAVGHDYANPHHHWISNAVARAPASASSDFIRTTPAVQACVACRPRRLAACCYEACLRPGSGTRLNTARTGARIATEATNQHAPRWRAARRTKTGQTHCAQYGCEARADAFQFQDRADAAQQQCGCRQLESPRPYRP